MTQDAVMTLTEPHLSFRARILHLALLLAALGMGTVIAALLLSEPALPPRTMIAFALLLLVSLAWSLYAGWVLTARKTMLAAQRIVAGRIAVSAAVLFTLGAALLGVMTPWAAAWAAAGLGLVLLCGAVLLLRRAQRQHRALLQRRTELEARLHA